ncbi:S1 family peptidase [Flectobacillus longus]|uniref:S1 family peptidase n=1 Tax=Flectobacillus longus TaxID=2984207 RepID=UPI0024B6639B|nr:serine protease [Flectobacillus longus]MDI9880765.1 serine protease [Flectobacillus longus]
MDLQFKWKISYQSICRIAHYKDGTLIGTGTGFKLKEHLVTNNHVYFPLNSDRIEVSFVKADSHSKDNVHSFSKHEWESMLIGGSPENLWDYAILNLEGTPFCNIPGLAIAPTNQAVKIGSSIYFLGYPLMQENLTIHTGYISSSYIKNSVEYIQLDASVNSGNSGGPLIDFDTDTVVGIITRKNTGLSGQFRTLKQNLLQNISDLGKSNMSGGVYINGIDPINAFKVIQSQIDLLSSEVERSSNVGIGYAFSKKELQNFI